MALIAESEEEEIRRLLGGTEEELARAFERLDAEYRPRFVASARKRFPRLSADDYADAWQDVLKDLLQTRRSGRFGDVRRVFAWLWTVFHRRLHDQAQDSDKRRQIWEHVQERLKGTRVGELVGEMEPARRAAFFRRIRAVVENLPPRQKLVVETFIEGYPHTEWKEELRRRVSLRSGREETLKAVVSALSHVRAKARAMLAARTPEAAGERHG